MSFAELGLVAMTTLVSAFAIATLVSEFWPMVSDLFKQRPLMQTGDSSLSPKSVNWLAAVAFAGALLICFVLA